MEPLQEIERQASSAFQYLAKIREGQTGDLAEEEMVIFHRQDDIGNNFEESSTARVGFGARHIGPLQAGINQVVAPSRINQQRPEGLPVGRSVFCRATKGPIRTCHWH